MMDDSISNDNSNVIEIRPFADIAEHVRRKCFLFLPAVLSFRLSSLSMCALGANAGKWLQPVLIRPTKRRVVPPTWTRGVSSIYLRIEPSYYNHYAIKDFLGEKGHVERYLFYEDCDSRDIVFLVTFHNVKQAK